MSFQNENLRKIIFHEQNGSGSGDASGRGNGHPGDNPFYSNIDSMPDIRPRRKSIPLVSELVSSMKNIKYKKQNNGCHEKWGYDKCPREIKIICFSK